MFAKDTLTEGHDHGTPGPCGQPQGNLGIEQTGGQHEFRAQYPILRFPPRPALSEAPASSNFGARPLEVLRQKAPGWIRKVIPSLIERRSPEGGPLTGQVSEVRADPEGRGVLIAGVHQHAVGARNAGDVLINGFERDIIPVPGTGEPRNDDNDNVAPDVLDHVQSTASDPHFGLRSARASYPGLQVIPVPQTRAAIITAKNLPVEIPLPSGTVFFYVSWSGRYAGADLIVSMIGGLGGVGALAANANFDTLDGMFINPAEGQRFYSKGKQAITVMVPNSSPLIAPFFVSVECYLNN